MICDKSLEISSGQGSITSAGAYYGTNWIDLSTVGTQLYESGPYFVVRVGTAFATGDSLSFALVSTTAPATDAAGTSLGTTTVEVESGAILTASLTINTIVWKVRLPEKIDRRYLGLKITAVASSSFNAGTFDAFFTPHIPLAAV